DFHTNYKQVFKPRKLPPLARPSVSNIPQMIIYDIVRRESYPGPLRRLPEGVFKKRDRMVNAFRLSAYGPSKNMGKSSMKGGGMRKARRRGKMMRRPGRRRR
ncbi:MAG: hypothetical protein AAFO91_00195, partial [Bacteroidota bacterium]